MGQFRFDKRWIGRDGFMESIGRGWEKQSGENSDDFVTKISNCCHETSKWRKDNPPYGKEKIGELQQALEKVQSDNNMTQEEKIEVSRKLHEAYKDEEGYCQQKSRNM